MLLLSKRFNQCDTFIYLIISISIHIAHGLLSQKKKRVQTWTQPAIYRILLWSALVTLNFITIAILSRRGHPAEKRRPPKKDFIFIYFLPSLLRCPLGCSQTRPMEKDPTPNPNLNPHPYPYLYLSPDPPLPWQLSESESRISKCPTLISALCL